MGNLGLRLRPHSTDEGEMNHLEKLLRVAYSYSACTVQPLNVNVNGCQFPTSSAGPSYSNALDSHAQLMAALDNCTSEDVNLVHSVDRMSKGVAPVGYIHLHENKWFSLGVFVIYKGDQGIPLHDHPGMVGMLKVIHGKVRIKSYTVKATDPFGMFTTVREECPVVLDQTQPPCFLGPEDKNIHEIEYVDVDNPSEEKHQERPYASFIDFLSPPYRADPSPFTEVCNYYEFVPTQDRNHCVMRKSASPKTYWNEELPYTGHSLQEIIEELRRKHPESH